MGFSRWRLKWIDKRTQGQGLKPVRTEHYSARLKPCPTKTRRQYRKGRSKRRVEMLQHFLYAVTATTGWLFGWGTLANSSATMPSATMSMLTSNPSA